MAAYVYSDKGHCARVIWLAQKAQKTRSTVNDTSPILLHCIVYADIKT